MSNYDIHKYIHESNLIEGIDNENEDVQSYKAWLYLKEQKIITKQVLRDLHTLITKNLLPVYEQGFFRSELSANVYINNKLAPAPFIVDALIDNWILDYGVKAEDPTIAHIRYEHIHPWIDGNGRTGRMLLWWHELKNKDIPSLYSNVDKYIKYYPLFLK